MKKIILTEENIYRGNLILINPGHPARNLSCPLSAADARYKDIKLQSHAAAALSELVSSLKQLGFQDEIIPVSGYRTFSQQSEIYQSSLSENGREFTEKFVAIPGHSEHQSGLAIDLALKRNFIDFICPDFPAEGICGEFKRRAPSHGFILRYPKDKEDITCISHEPWHFRYVGTPHSRIIRDKGLTLEEYVDFIAKHTKSQPFLYKDNLGTAEIFFLPLEDNKRTSLTLSENSHFEISGNNADGFIVTVFHRVA